MHAVIRHTLGVLRLFDFACVDCGFEQEALVDVPRGDVPAAKYELECDDCDTTTWQERQLSAPAPYMGEKNLSPLVRGGRFDTAGQAPMPSYPDMPGEADYQAKLSRALSCNPVEDRASVMRSMINEAPALEDYAAHMSKPECVEIKRERKRIGGQNSEKQKRLAAARRGENVNFRRDKCAGDPAL